jgi:hypothetical protein
MTWTGRQAQIIFRGQWGLGSLACNAHSVIGHGERRINDMDYARISGKIAALGLISQGAMLVKANLMIVVGAVLACNGACLPMHLLVKVEQIL